MSKPPNGENSPNLVTLSVCMYVLDNTLLSEASDWADEADDVLKKAATVDHVAGHNRST
jgi:hypothetical protein